jgi:MFS family permease
VSESAKDDALAPPAPKADGWLNRNVVGMGLSSLLSDASHETATSVLPGFLTALGAPIYSLGLIEGLSDATASFLKLAAGWRSDRLGRRKPGATLGYVLTGGAFAIVALAVSWPVVLLGRMLAWLGRGIRSPLRDAILAESIAPQDRGKAFGFHRAGDTIGAITGPLAAAGLLYLLRPYQLDNPALPFRIVLFLTLIPGLGAAAAFAWLVTEKARPPNRDRRFWASVRALPTGFRRFLLGVGVFGIGDFAAALLILAAATLLEPAMGKNGAAEVSAILYAWRNVIYAAASYPVGALSDRIGRQGLLAAGYVLGGVVAALLAFAMANSLAAIVLLAAIFTISGVSAAIVDSLEGAATADLVPDTSLRGTAYAVRGSVNGLGDFVSSAIVGLLWYVQPALGFGYAAVLMALGGLLLFRVRMTPTPASGGR